jgi:hypothetical protein
MTETEMKVIAARAECRVRDSAAVGTPSAS